VVAWNEEYRRIGGSVLLKRFRQSLPKVGFGFRVIEQVSGAEQRMYRVASRDFEELGDHVHTRP
jgi:hypothetical protein